MMETNLENKTLTQKMETQLHNDVHISNEASAELNIQKPLLIGTAIIIIFFVLGIAWSLLVTIQSAAIAPGTLTVKSHRQVVQHLSGGTIKSIHVRNGEEVQAQQIIISLDSNKARTTFKILKQQADSLSAQQARLQAQRDNSTTITWPTRLLKSKNDPVTNKLFILEERILRANVKNFTDQLSILKHMIIQYQKEILSIKAQSSAQKTQLELIEKELSALEYLDQRRLIEKPRIYAIKRQQAQLRGNIGRLSGQIARTLQKISEVQQRIITLTSAYQKKNVENLAQVQNKLNEILNKENNALQILNKTVLRAPQSGIVYGLSKHTIGAIITPGETVAEIVPANDPIIVEVNINPMDIDVVKVGMPAKVSLSALKMRTAKPLNGTVNHISADHYIDKTTGKPYYRAQISFSKTSLKQINKSILYPGMPVEVMLLVDQQTPFRYAIAPLLESFNRAFLEP